MTRLVRAELLKLTTVRTPLGLVLGLVVVSAVAVSGLVATGSADHPDGPLRVVQAVSVGSTFATILGILVMTNEFRHGTITQSLLVTPVREHLVVAKLLTGLLAGALYAVAALGVALAVVVPWTAARGDEMGWDAGDALPYGRLVLAFALWTGLGVGIGIVVRNQVAAIVGTFAWFLIGEALLTLLGIAISGGDFEGNGAIAPYLPGSAFEALVGRERSIDGADVLLSPLAGLVLVLVYVAVITALGAVLFSRRDPR